MAQAARYALPGPFGSEKASSGNSKGMPHGPRKYTKHGTFSSNIMGMQQPIRTSAHTADAPVNKSRRAATLTLLGLATSLTLRPAEAGASVEAEAMKDAPRLKDLLLEAVSDQTISVLPGGKIMDAVEIAPVGGTILIPPGEWREKLVLTKPVTLRAIESDTVTLKNTIIAPDDCVIEVLSEGVQLEGLRVKHSSKAALRNYGVFCLDASLKMVRCDITSTSGSAVGVEGGKADFKECIFRGSKEHGVVLFDCRLAVMDQCGFVNNKGDGARCVDGANAKFLKCTFRGNQGYGLCVLDSSARLENTFIFKNFRGSVCAIGDTFLELAGKENKLDKPVKEKMSY